MSDCVYSQYSDKCNIYLLKSDYDCTDSSTIPIDTVKIGDYYGTDSRCFESNIKLDKLNRYGLNGRCYKYKCNSNKSLSVYVANYELVCIDKDQVILGPTGTGTLICPDVNKICQQNFICPRYCSQRGACIKGSCECYDGYSGKACQCFPGSVPDSSDNCVCPQGKANDGKTCVDCGSNCLDCTNTLSCNQCAKGYRISTGNGSCTTCQDGYFEQVQGNQVKCVACQSTCNQCYGQDSFCTKCPTGKYLLRSTGTCQTRCPLGYYENTSLLECIPCNITSCQSCNSGPSVCDSCLNDLFLSYNLISCSTSCLSTEYSTVTTITTNGKFISTKKCMPCSLTCTSCYGADKANCTKCSSATYLSNNTCVSTCPAGTYPDTVNRICQQCTTNCLSCVSQNTCTTCSSNTYILKLPISQTDSTIKTTCNTVCPQTTFKVDAIPLLNILAECKNCISNCAKCSTTSDCQSCSTGYFMISSGQTAQCVSQCPNANQLVENINLTAYYTDISSSQCMKCLDYCGICQDNTTCTTCKAGYARLRFSGKNDQCLSSCPLNYTLNSTNRVCLKCIDNCSSCDSSNLNQCTQCQPNYYILKGNTQNDVDMCLLTCPKSQGYFEDSINQKCSKCSQNCQQCSNQNSCQICSSPTYLLTDSITGKQTCVPVCPDGYYAAQNSTTNICAKCLDNCSKCTNKTTCNVCQTNYSLFSQPPQSDLCLQKCPSGSYLDSQTQNCKQCLTNCSLCQNITSCDICSSSYLRLRSSNQSDLCLQSCLNGFYQLGAECKQCIDGCQVCKDNKICQQCKTPFILLPIGLIDGQTNDTCIAKCPNGYFTQTQNDNNLGNIDKCDKCVANCISCKNNTACDQCSQNYFNLKVQNQNDLCIPSCPQGYFANTQTGQCQQCLDNCFDCSSKGGSAKKCYQCTSGHYLIQQQDADQCLIHCPTQNYFQNEQTKNCEPCKTQFCGVCSSTSSSVCDSCSPNYFLLKSQNIQTIDQCITDCPSQKYYKDLSVLTCQPCSDNCLYCNNKQECVTCVDGFYMNDLGSYLNDKICIQTCPQYKYINTQTKKCENCLTNCIQCSSSYRCLACDTNQYLYQGTNLDECRQVCGVGLYENSINQKCDSCIQNCDKCSTSGDCFKCKNGFNLYQVSQNTFQCVQVCPQKTYAQNQICKQCLQNCQICSSNNQCNTCSSGFNLIQASTATQIYSTDYSTNTDSCISVQTPCPLRTYLEVAAKECKICQADCKQCVNSQFCSICQDPYILLILNTQNGKVSMCQNFCPAGYFVEIVNSNQQSNIPLYRRCSSCLQNCAQCKNEDTCSQCQNSYSLLTKSEFILQNPNTPNPDDIIDQCLSSCPEKFFFNQEKKECDGCSNNCQICSSEQQCQQCFPSYFLLNDKKTNSEICVKKCPTQNYFEDKYLWLCDECDIQNCSICSESPQSCIECKQGYFYYKLNDQILKGECLQNCPPYFYADQISKQCMPCQQGCLNCSSQIQCNQCESQLNLLSGRLSNQNIDQCLINCPQSFYTLFHEQENHKVCNKCIQDCEKCSDNLSCEQCQKGYYILTVDDIQQCVPGCPLSFYYLNEQNQSCELCQQGCEICQNGHTCAKCIGDLILFNLKDEFGRFIKDECISECPINKYYVYHDQQNTSCKECDILNCLTCPSSSVCTQCDEGYYLLNSGNIITCVQNCPSGYYQDNKNASCKKCLENCQICQNDFQCQACKPWLTLQSNLYMNDVRKEICSNNCPQGYYKIEDDKYNQYICKPCLDNCKICSSSFSCSQCQYDKILLSRILVHSQADQCIQSCPKGFVSYGEIQDNGDNIYRCVPCSPNCIDCSTPFGQSVWTNQIEISLNIKQQNYCIECSTGYLRFMSPSNQYQVSCLNICPENYFADDFNQICLQCQDGCKSCQSQDYCLNCEEGKLLIDLQSEEGKVYTNCLDKCPDQYYLDIQINQCTRCMENCLQCSNSQTCIKCEGSYFLSQDGKCSLQCGQSQYKQNNECKPCSQNCLECENSNTCLKCKNQYLLLEQKITQDGSFIISEICVQSCPISYFTSNNSVVNPSQNPRCLKCLDNCSSCMDETSCFLCNSQFYLFQKNLEYPQFVSDLCLNHCPEKFYKDLTTLTCKKCSDNCNTCQNNMICTSCERSKYLIQYNDSTNGCLAECPQSYYPDSTNGQLNCEKCDQKCQICTNKFQCTQCASSFYLYTVDSNNTSCVNNCPSGYYKSKDSNGVKLCKKCNIDNCSICFENSPDTCQQCSTSYYLTKAGSFLNQNKDLCILTCPSGTYKEEGNIQQCKVCPINCQVCSDSISCQICNSSYFLLQDFQGSPTKCLEKCPNGYYVNPSLNQCIQCTDQNCLDCPNNLRCNDCTSPYKLLMSEEIDSPDQCITNCPNGHYEKQIYSNSNNNSTNITNQSNDVICDKCQVNCTSCKNNKKCLKCDNGYGLLEGNCLSTIPPQYYLQNGIILQCLSNCQMCADGVSCQTCLQSYYLLHKLGQSDQCMQNCPNQYYKSFSSQSCEPCFSNCETCTTQNNCNQCSQNYYLFESNGTQQCLMSCPPQYYADNISKKCQQCPPQCTECSKASNCSKCTQGFKLLKQNQSNSCVSICPQSYRETSTECIQCSSNCDKCQVNESICQNCKQGYYLNSSDFNCYPCQNNQLACDECSQQQKYKQYLTITYYQCLDKCLDGFYESVNSPTNEYICKYCQISGCRKCSSQSTCLVCYSSTPYMVNGICQEACPQSGYYDTIVKNVVQGQSYDQHICQKCLLQNCQQCNLTGDSCLSCSNNFFLYKTQCLQNCPSGTRKDQNLKQCIDCSVKNCSNCQTSVNTCDTCQSLFYLNTALLQCLPCISNCLECTGINQCSKCQNGFFFDVIQSACVTSCLPGYYKDIAKNTCQKCNAACKTCQGPNSTDCLSCNNLYYSEQKQILQTITCLEGCGPGKVRRTQLPYLGLVDECQPCYKGCSKCYDVFNTQCLACYDGYTLIKGTCYDCTKVNCSQIV